jgi:hypothetical protein
MGALINAEDIREGDYVIMRKKTKYVNVRQVSYKTIVVRIWDLREVDCFKNIRIIGERNTPKNYLTHSNSTLWEYEKLDPWDYYQVTKAAWRKMIGY